MVAVLFLNINKDFCCLWTNVKKRSGIGLNSGMGIYISIT